MTDEVDRELERQVEVLVGLGVPELAGLGTGELESAVEALRGPLRKSAAGQAAPSRVPFVLVVAGEPDGQMRLAERLVPSLRLTGSGREGVLDRNHGEAGLAPYQPIEQIGAAPDRIYALVDVERGEQFCGVRPQEALPQILDAGRTPLTILEGIVLVLTHPQVLEKNRCFMLSGSRRGDKRVPALWISGRAPKLGWCWDGNPHSWLGVASTASRVGVAAVVG